MRVLVLIVLLFAVPAKAETFCGRQLTMPGTTPTQASLIAHGLALDPRSLPGFPALLLNDLAGSQPRTLRGDRIEPSGGVFPDTNGFPQATPLRPDGSVFGGNMLTYGKDNVLSHLAPGSDAFQAVEGTGNPAQCAYDPAEHRLSLRGRRHQEEAQCEDGGRMVDLHASRRLQNTRPTTASP